MPSKPDTDADLKVRLRMPAPTVCCHLLSEFSAVFEHAFLKSSQDRFNIQSGAWLQGVTCCMPTRPPHMGVLSTRCHREGPQPSTGKIWRGFSGSVVQ